MAIWRGRAICRDRRKGEREPGAQVVRPPGSERGSLRAGSYPPMRLDEDVLVHRMVDVLAPLLGETRPADLFTGDLLTAGATSPIYGYALRTEEKHALTPHVLSACIHPLSIYRRGPPSPSPLAASLVGAARRLLPRALSARPAPRGTDPRRFSAVLRRPGRGRGRV